MDFEKEIQSLISGYSNPIGIERLCLNILQEIKSYYKDNGYPKELSIHKLSLIPSLFQEANYDNIVWSSQYGELGHLNILFQLDCMFHNNGKSREKLSEKDFFKYVDFSSQAINSLKNKNKQPTTIAPPNNRVIHKLKTWFS